MANYSRLSIPFLGSALRVFLNTLDKGRLPNVTGEIRAKGIDSPVDILRDEWGVPHMYGSSARDVIFTQGYVHAQDRLWQMDFTRRVISGRLAEVVGDAGIPVDRAMRTLSLRLTAEKEAGLVSGRLKSLLQSYCEGVNIQIKSAIKKRKLPIEFTLLGYEPEPWEIADSLSWEKLMCWTLAANWQSEFLRGEIIKKLSPEKTRDLEININKAWAIILDLGQASTLGKTMDAIGRILGHRAGDGVGSNNWVLHGTRTKTGMPLLANDMHLELTAPGIWYENHLVGGELDITGVSLPGAPMIIAGHNRNVAWGFTDSCPDTQDLYEEHLRSDANGDWQYEFKSEWYPATVRKEEIKVKKGRNVTQDVVVTRHGPIINALIHDSFPSAPPLALRWTALDPDETFQAIYDMNVAQNCRDFKEALRKFDNPSQNIVFADTHGNIGYVMNGKIPIRDKGNGSVPAPGWTGEYEWSGYIPFEELPALENPPSGYIVTANNQIQPEGYPHFLGIDYLVSERAGRITEMVEKEKKIDVQYIKSMHYDTVSISSRILARYLGKLKPESADLTPIIERMSAWDGDLDRESVEATIYETTIHVAIRLLLEHHLGDLGKMMLGNSPVSGQWPDHSWEWFVHLLETPESAWFDLGHGEKRDDLLLLALSQAVELLKTRLGPSTEGWQWGKIHQLTFGHILGNKKPLDCFFNLGPFPIGGDGNTIAASSSSFLDLETRRLVGPPFRFIADLSNLDRCFGLLAPGQSGHPASRHYKDGIGPWLSGCYHPILFNREDVEQNIEAIQKLIPG